MEALTETVPVRPWDIVAAALGGGPGEEPTRARIQGDFDAAAEFPSARAAVAAALADAGVRGGDRVLVPAYTCRALVSAVDSVATPAFVDVSATDFNIDLSQLERMAADAEAVVPVHLFGNPVDMEAVQEIADDEELVVVEDAAQAVGTALTSSVIGTASNYCVFSFRFTKEVTTYRGGLLVGDDLPSPSSSPPARTAPARLAAVTLLNGLLGALPGRAYAPLRRGVIDPLFRARSETVGRRRPRDLSRLQRKLLERQLAALPSRVRVRRQHAARYRRNLDESVQLPPDSSAHTYFRFPVLVDAEVRREITHALRSNGVGVSTMYSYTVSPRGQCERADEIASRIVNLPVHADLPPATVDRITRVFNRIIDRYR